MERELKRKIFLCLSPPGGPRQLVYFYLLIDDEKEKERVRGAEGGPRMSSRWKNPKPLNRNSRDKEDNWKRDPLRLENYSTYISSSNLSTIVLLIHPSIQRDGPASCRFYLVGVSASGELLRSIAGTRRGNDGHSRHPSLLFLLFDPSSRSCRDPSIHPSNLNI